MKNIYNRNVINVCTPGKSFEDIVHSLSLYEIDSLTNIIILCGDSSQVRKREILININFLLKLQSETGCKLVISSFPYAKNLTREQNQHIYELNSYLFNLINCHSDKVLYFDINNFINNFILTSDTMYLANRFRTKIAKLLAFNLQDTFQGGKPKSFDSDFSSLPTNNNLINLNNINTSLQSENVSKSALN